MKIGFIDYYLDEWHANNYPRLIAQASGGEMSVALAWARIDSPLTGGRTSAQWSRDLGIPLAGSLEELIAESDALVVLSPDNCEMHEQLSELALRSGKPTYIDKTFAPDRAAAERIFAAAEVGGTPCYSTSALRFAPEYQGIEGVRAISAWGPGGYETYSIHQLEPIMMLMRCPARRVIGQPFAGGASLVIEFVDGRTANMNCFEAGAPFMMHVCADAGNRVVKLEADYFQAFIERLVAFFRTGVAPVAHGDTIDIMAVRGAGAQALAMPGTWIEVARV